MFDKAGFFFEELTKVHISANHVRFDDNISDDVFCVNKNYNKYEVFYRERGQIFDLSEFNRNPTH
jgi:hypothetical protein